MRFALFRCPKCGKPASDMVERRIIRTGISQEDGREFEYAGTSEDVYEGDEPVALSEVIPQLEDALHVAQRFLNGDLALPQLTVQVQIADALDAISGAQNDVTLRCDDCCEEWRSSVDATVPAI